MVSAPVVLIVVQLVPFDDFIILLAVPLLDTAINAFAYDDQHTDVQVLVNVDVLFVQVVPSDELIIQPEPTATNNDKVGLQAIDFQSPA